MSAAAAEAFPELVSLVTTLDACAVRAVASPASPAKRTGRRMLSAPPLVLAWWATAASALLAFVTAPVLDGWRSEVNANGTHLASLALGWTAVCLALALLTTVLSVRKSRPVQRPFVKALLASLDERGDARAAVRAAAGLDTEADDDETLRIEVQAGLGAPLGDAASALFAVPDADLVRGLRRLAHAVGEQPAPVERAALLETAAVVTSGVTCGLLFWNSLSGALGL